MPCATIVAEALDRFDFRDLMEEKIKLLQMPEDLLTRSVNVGFSGGEKKRNDILQMAVLEPELCILDESDSGLDIDALKIVSGSECPARRQTRLYHCHPLSAHP